MDIIISTAVEGLELRGMDHKWCAEIYNGLSAEVLQYMTFPPPVEINDTRTFVSTSIQTNANGTNLQCVITADNGNEFMGCAGLHNIGSRGPELGLWLCKSHWGRGYGSAVLMALIQWAEQNVVYEFLRYPVCRANVASVKIVKKFNPVAAGSFTCKHPDDGRNLDMIEYRIYPHCSNSY